MTSQLTTHILDTTTGLPAASVVVTLATGAGIELARGATDADGRLALGAEALDAGTYRLRFETGEYFAGAGREVFYPSVAIEFVVSEARHYHVPLLLSPFGYSTYRGS